MSLNLAQSVEDLEDKVNLNLLRIEEFKRKEEELTLQGRTIDEQFVTSSK